MSSQNVLWTNGFEIQDLNVPETTASPEGPLLSCVHV
uniref:Uncharacterized protein n=1 Tax=Anguilla anguilla TaxID=7936 RepID=A0A0E9WV43_ANGAN